MGSVPKEYQRHPILRVRPPAKMLYVTQRVHFGRTYRLSSSFVSRSPLLIAPPTIPASQRFS
jgi:hypothetical protein